MAKHRSKHRSYAITNNLFYEKNRTAQLPHNLWATIDHLKIQLKWCEQELYMAGDVPTKMGKVDYQRIVGLIPSSGMYLTCCSIQKSLGPFLNQQVQGSCQVNQDLISQSKELLCMSIASALSLSKWEHVLGLMPLEDKEKETIFTVMLKKCKITKFQEVNFKILSRILLIPAVLSAIKSNPSIGFCHWCGARANIDHILLDCVETKKLHKLVELIISQLQHDSWVLGAS